MTRFQGCEQREKRLFAVLQAFGTLWEPTVHRLLKPMILTGLSEPLTRALLKISKKLPNTTPAIQQHLLLPVLAALPVTMEHPEPGAVSGMAPGVPVAGALALHTSARHRDMAAQGRGHALARSCFHVKSSILKPNLQEFAKQVHAQVGYAPPTRVQFTVLDHLALAVAHILTNLCGL